MIMQTVSGIKKTLILVTSVSMMGTTMPQMTQNNLIIHHHSMDETMRMAKTARTGAQMVSMMMAVYVMMRMVSSKTK